VSDEPSVETSVKIDVETSVETSVEIELNGAPHRLTGNPTLHDLIASLALTDQALAVAVNREVVPRRHRARNRRRVSVNISGDANESG